MASRNGHGAHEAPGTGRGRRAAIVGVLVLLVGLAFGGGYLLARGGDENQAASSPSASATPAASETISPSPTETAASTPSSTPEPVLEDGRHFVFARSAKASPASLRFDLAEFLTDQEAEDAAEEHGDEAVNGYYIVNDNPRLRTLPAAAGVGVRYLPVGSCCDLVAGTWDQYVEAVNDTAQTDLDPTAPWWITVRSGEIVRIEQQYLP